MTNHKGDLAPGLSFSRILQQKIATFSIIMTGIDDTRLDNYVSPVQASPENAFLMQIAIFLIKFLQFFSFLKSTG